jgi:hypothetical protein
MNNKILEDMLPFQAKDVG